jgi:VWFA-related protein
MSVIRRAVALGLVLAAAGGLGAAPQERKPQVFGVDVRLVAVPVFVTDKNAQSVGGLTAADFEIEEQGKKLPIAGFLAVDAGAAAADLPPGTSPALAAASRRQFLLLFDQSFSTSSTLIKARQGTLKMLAEATQPGDLVAVASVGLGGLRILTNFTPDRAQAATAVASLGAGDTNRLRDPLGIAYDLGISLQVDIGSLGLQTATENDRDQVLQLARSERDQYRQRVLAYVDSLAELGKLLDSVQGRKQVILLSSGFDQTVLSGATGTEQAESAASVATGRIWEVQSDRHFGDAQAHDQMSRLFQTLTRSDTVVHTIHLTEAGPGAGLSEQGNVPAGSGRETLAELAGRSGGRFVREPSDMASALREVLGATRHYYVIAFEPADAKKKPGELRKLKVRVKRPGLEVSHRAGYTVPDPSVGGAQRQLSAAEVIAKGLSGGAFRLSALAVPYRAAGAEVSLSVVLEIDGEGLLSGAGTEPLPLEIYGYAFDGQGRVADAVGLTPMLDLAAMTPALRGKGVQVLTTFRVPPGPVDLRFLVREGRQGRAASLRVAATVPTFEGAEAVLSAPLLMDDPRSRVVIPTPSRRYPQLQIPFRVEDTAFTPMAVGALRAGQPQEVCLMAFGGAPGTGARIEAELVGMGGAPLAVEAGPPRVVADADGVFRVVFTLTPGAVPAGEYQLRARLVDGTRTVVASELPVVVL